jgi:syntaxin 16
MIFPTNSKMIKNCTFKVKAKKFFFYIFKELKEIKSRKRNLNLNYESSELDSETSKKLENLQDQIFAKGFSETQMSEILRTQREIIERDQELETVLVSIVELQELFKEVSDAVIEQGTLLDRIDNNIDNTKENVQQAVGHLEVNLFL